MGRHWDLHFQCDFDLEISTRYCGRLGLFSVTLDFSRHARNIWRTFFGVHTLSMLEKYAKSCPPSLHYQVFGSACYWTLLLKMWRCSWDVHIWAPQYLKHLKWPGVHLLSLRCDIQRSRVRRWKFGIPLFRAEVRGKKQNPAGPSKKWTPWQKLVRTRERYRQQHRRRHHSLNVTSQISIRHFIHNLLASKSTWMWNLPILWQFFFGNRTF